MTREQQLEDGCIKLSYALSKIDYALGPPNDMECSEYDWAQDEGGVVHRVQMFVDKMRQIAADESYCHCWDKCPCDDAFEKIRKLAKDALGEK